MITSDAQLKVQYLSGKQLGTVEESFISRLRPGDRFVFAGKVLEFIRLREMTAWVAGLSFTLLLLGYLVVAGT